MFELVKQKIAQFIVDRKLKNNKIERKSFNNLLKNSFRFLILMPANEINFHHALEVLKFFDKLNKETTVFTQDFRVNLLPGKYRHDAIDYGIADINKLGLPAQTIEKKFSELNFDVVIDLEKDENLFNSLLVSLIKAPVKAGFRKNSSDKFYTLQIDNTEDNPEIIYKNLLNCLQMF